MSEKACQQVHKNCGGIIVLMGQNGTAFLMCRKCFEQWHPQLGLSIAVSKDFENPQAELCETYDRTKTREGNYE